METATRKGGDAQRPADAVSVQQTFGQLEERARRADERDRIADRRELMADEPLLDHHLEEILVALSGLARLQRGNPACTVSTCQARA